MTKVPSEVKVHFSNNSVTSRLPPTSENPLSKYHLPQQEKNSIILCQALPPHIHIDAQTRRHTMTHLASDMLCHSTIRHSKAHLAMMCNATLTQRTWWYTWHQMCIVTFPTDTSHCPTGINTLVDTFGSFRSWLTHSCSVGCTRNDTPAGDLYWPGLSHTPTPIVQVVI